MTPPRWVLRWWRQVALAFAVMPALGALALLLLGERCAAGAIGFSALLFWLNFNAVHDLSRKLDRRLDRLDRRASATGPDLARVARRRY